MRSFQACPMKIERVETLLVGQWDSREGLDLIRRWVQASGPLVAGGMITFGTGTPPAAPPSPTKQSNGHTQARSANREHSRGEHRHASMRAATGAIVGSISEGPRRCGSVRHELARTSTHPTGRPEPPRRQAVWSTSKARSPSLLLEHTHGVTAQLG